jgi:alcohol dehydrogenase class IV
VYFRGFTPNPKQEEVEAGIQFFRENECEGIIAIGGGSAIDVAKCIKLNITDDINFAAIPTTAGSGSEATRFAVIYENGEKKSIQDESLLPECVLLDASTLENLPGYQRKATFLDAYCHAVESYWSRNSTEESKKYAVTAIELLTGYIDEYMQGNKEAAEKILNASYQAGRAINISKTTAGHAMCYKLTTLYGLEHGHAAALCVINCWKFMQKSSALDVLEELEPALKKLEIIYDKFNLETPKINDEKEIEILKKSVNTERLQNHPIRLTEDDLGEIYRAILDFNNP